MSRSDLRIPRCPTCGMVWSHDCATCRTAMAQDAEPSPPRESRMWCWLFCGEMVMLAVVVITLLCYAVLRP